MINQNILFLIFVLEILGLAWVVNQILDWVVNQIREEAKNEK